MVTNDPTSIPLGLPLFRGIHLCTPNFTEKFKQTFLVDSSSLATILNGTNEEAATQKYDPKLTSQVKALFKNPYLYPQEL
jgi:hypothetical protein